MGGNRIQIIGKVKTSATPQFTTGHRTWRKLKADFKAHHASAHSPCWICLRAIEYEKASGPWSFEADHYRPRKTHPHLAFQWSNLRPSHQRCNRSRQHKDINEMKSVGAQDNWVRPTW